MTILDITVTGATYHDCPTHYSNREEQRTMTVHREYSVTRGATYHDYPRHYSNREEQRTKVSK